ncbi:hypothetical protein E6C55_31880 [Cohnella fermenti]|uniref:Bacterial transcriptional activator domain-containing protein n=2 Tax=Cohnella fermenti TaxID=2565925 RepID=A0A4S4BEV6_9BACL|nr:hypothetical protein E6C55_31880 [Cohnella fermenti]
MDGFRIRVNGEPVEDGLSRKNVKRLLLYLLLHPSASREAICDELWPDALPDNARNLLRVSLTHLRKLLGRRSSFPFVYSNREKIELSGTVRCDLLEFQSDLANTLKCEASASKCDAAIRLLRRTPRTMLHGIYDEWATGLRRKWENELFELIEWAEGYAAQREEWDRAARLLEAAASVFPWEEQLQERAARYRERHRERARLEAQDAEASASARIMKALR